MNKSKKSNPSNESSAVIKTRKHFLPFQGVSVEAADVAEAIKLSKKVEVGDDIS